MLILQVKLVYLRRISKAIRKIDSIIYKNSDKKHKREVLTEQYYVSCDRFSVYVTDNKSPKQLC